MCVATSKSMDVWGVGVGMRGKNRFVACKVALATAIAIEKLSLDGEVTGLSLYPEIAKFVEEARAARDQLDED